MSWEAGGSQQRDEIGDKSHARVEEERHGLVEAFFSLCIERSVVRITAKNRIFAERTFPRPEM